MWRVNLIRVAIVDDDLTIQNRLKQYINDYEKEKKEKFKVTTYNDAADIVEHYKGHYDIIFMDIQMEKMDGLTAAGKIREVDKKAIIIFVTNMAGYAIQGYKVDALSYVVKPIVYVDFAQQLDKALSKIALSKSAFLLVTVGSEIIRLDITKISYMESIEHKIYIHLENETIAIYNSLSKLEQLVKKYHFARCNSCFLVSLKHVERVEKDTVIVNGEALVVSRSKKKNFMNALAEYIGGDFI